MLSPSLYNHPDLAESLNSKLSWPVLLSKSREDHKHVRGQWIVQQRAGARARKFVRTHGRSALITDAQCAMYSRKKQAAIHAYQLVKSTCPLQRIEERQWREYISGVGNISNPSRYAMEVIGLKRAHAFAKGLRGMIVVRKGRALAAAVGYTVPRASSGGQVRDFGPRRSGTSRCGGWEGWVKFEENHMERTGDGL
jgi:hypothetical protein